jgi:hypothetical protein
LATTDTNAIVSVSTDTSTTSSVDLYKIATIVDNIKAKFIDIPEDTLTMGIYGYLSEMHTNIIENAVVMASEYSNEAVPTKAKFERNILCHALSLGLSKITATPAEMNVVICIPETNLIANMQDNKFTFDKEFAIKIGDYEYHVDYDIIIERILLPTGVYAFTAKYDIDGRNKVSDIINPYLPTIGYIMMNSSNLIMINTTIRQITHNTVYKKIITTNPLENKVITFSFTDQLAYFNVEVVEGNTTHWLTPVYDGLEDTSVNYEYCSYMYIDTNTIRIKFNRDSYQPTTSCDVTVHAYTTKGSECNFSYTDNITQTLTSDTYSYDNMFIVTKPISDSENGTDKKTIAQLKEAIPKEAISRGVVSTYTDINNYFNTINTDDCRLYFLEKVHNQIEHLYYGYMLLKLNNNVVPTNTVDTQITNEMFSDINASTFIMKAGAIMYYDGTKTLGLPSTTSETDLTNYDNSGFLFMNPFLVVVNKNPFFVSYYMNILNYTRILSFEYINSKSQLQFIATTLTCKREYFTDRDTYKITVQMSQNLNSDYGLITTDDNGNITQCLVDVFGVIYVDGVAYRYVKGSITNYDSSEYLYTFQLEFKTNDIIDKNSKIAIEHGMYDVNTNIETTAYLPSNVDLKLYMLAKFDSEYGRGDTDKIIPGLEGYTLCNIYGLLDSTLDLYYNYSNIMTSYITLKRNDDASYSYYIKKMPLVRYTYMNTENRVNTFANILDKRRLWVESCLNVLWQPFGIDFKFFNTYGTSKLYSIDSKALLNRVNMSLTFEVKFQNASDSYILDDITNTIKEYMENINDISDLHMPNLITKVTNTYRPQLVYFKFIDLNGYGPIKQSIYKEDMESFVESTTVPEFLNVNTKNDDTPDITYNIVS